uniref:Putative secreted protein n=1 Tax=Anopheles darlingi TaxID=43151 RepID=A0A2M4D9T0_ANODA
MSLMLMLLLLPSMAGGWLTGLPRCTTSRFASSSPKSSSSSSASSLPIPRRRRRGVAQTQHTFTQSHPVGREEMRWLSYSRPPFAHNLSRVSPHHLRHQA